VRRLHLIGSKYRNREAEFIISTEAPDTYGTVFLISGGFKTLRE
jgi:hypothetical protein